MSSTFSRAFSFNQPLNNWNVSSVSAMNVMFSYASSFNQNISNWNTSSLGTSSSMYYNCPIDPSYKAPNT